MFLCRRSEETMCHLEGEDSGPEGEEGSSDRGECRKLQKKKAD
jgi:hypothetical protein